MKHDEPDPHDRQGLTMDDLRASTAGLAEEQLQDSARANSNNLRAEANLRSADEATNVCVVRSVRRGTRRASDAPPWMLTPHLRDIAHALILVSNKNGIYLATGTWGELWTRVVDHEVQRDAPWPVPYHLAEVPEAWELFAEANTARRGERNKIRKLKPVYAEEFLSSIRRSAESVPRRAKELLTWEDATFVREDR